MGLSRNKVAVPEGAAGTPPFWRGPESKVSVYYGCLYRINREKDEAESNKKDEVELNPRLASPIAQLVRALH